jgi:hypothetical protein
MLRSVNERGWGWTASEIRRVQLLEWVADEPVEHPGEYAEVKAFYDARPDQNENAIGVANDDLTYLTEARLIANGSGIGGIESMAAMLTAHGHDLLEQIRAQRAHKGQRRTACRDAMVAWLYAADATNIDRMELRELMLEDLQHGMWLSAPFAPADLADAAVWLREQGLVDGLEIDQDPGPIQLYLTGPGIVCAERFNSDTRRYQEERMAHRSGPTVTIGNNHGPVQVAGDQAHQVQQIGASAEHLRDLITSITELVRLAAPDADDLDAQRTAALAAAKDGAVDQSVINRFASWALAIVGKGASAALVPAVTAATNDMLHVAAQLPGHL